MYVKGCHRKRKTVRLHFPDYAVLNICFIVSYHIRKHFAKSSSDIFPRHEDFFITPEVIYM